MLPDGLLHGNRGCNPPEAVSTPIALWGWLQDFLRGCTFSHRARHQTIICCNLNTLMPLQFWSWVFWLCLFKFWTEKMTRWAPSGVMEPGQSRTAQRAGRRVWKKWDWISGRLQFIRSSLRSPMMLLPKAPRWCLKLFIPLWSASNFNQGTSPSHHSVSWRETEGNLYLKYCTLKLWWKSSTKKTTDCQEKKQFPLWSSLAMSNSNTHFLWGINTYSTNFNDHSYFYLSSLNIFLSTLGGEGGGTFHTDIPQIFCGLIWALQGRFLLQ